MFDASRRGYPYPTGEPPYPHTRIRGGPFIDVDTSPLPTGASLLRSVVAERAALRPDHAAAVALPPASDLSPNDWLLNSLCQFDLWWCVIAQTATPLDVSHGGVFNPSSAALHQYRSQPAIDKIALDPLARSTAFAGASDDQVAAALAKVLATAESQSHQYGGWWEVPSDNPKVAAWLSEHIK